jgi:hypothetical protein
MIQENLDRTSTARGARSQGKLVYKEFAEAEVVCPQGLARPNLIP